MGTELQHPVDLLTTLKRIKTCESVTNSGCWEIFKNRSVKHKLTSTETDQLQHSMDRLLEQYDRESVRTTMLKQEEIFKEQVQELHRLYEVQKTLVAELRNNKSRLHSPNNPSPRAPVNTDNQTRLWSTRTGLETNNSPFSNWNQSTQTYSGHNFHQLLSVRTEPSSQEQSSTSCSRDNLRKPKGFDLERPAEDLSRDMEVQPGSSSLRSSKDKMSIKSSNDQHFYTDGDTEVELTLSIGFGSNTKKPKNCQHISTLELSPNHKQTRQMDSSMSIRNRGDENSTSTAANASFDRESLQKPPWLLQTLSLNRT
ncbi:hypothetical protein BVC80_9081g85 [Macleaya cordata]|uniref:Uncharacterized protein n=1 Tax=Macleaya cordata TaxID=56857 RepID=A0A200PRT0_MACCD|nr:hypothetical protein BVC80_9081g85 [Macleaya cordata]